MRRRRDRRRSSNQELIMNNNTFENGLALLGALLILVAVSAAANIALTGDMGTVEIYGSAQS
jgi:hypothetical protein